MCCVLRTHIEHTWSCCTRRSMADMNTFRPDSGCRWHQPDIPGRWCTWSRAAADGQQSKPMSGRPGGDEHGVMRGISGCGEVVPFFSYSGWGETESTWYIGHSWPIVPAPDDRWWVRSSRWNENWQGKPKYSEKTCPSATLSTTNPTWPDLGSISGRRGGKPEINRLSYGTAYEVVHYFVSWSQGLARSSFW
jgi:hypothetical protein